jgi:hypothetical protein
MQFQNRKALSELRFKVSGSFHHLSGARVRPICADVEVAREFFDDAIVGLLENSAAAGSCEFPPMHAPSAVPAFSQMQRVHFGLWPD